jgi:hypothetical protein
VAFQAEEVEVLEVILVMVVMERMDHVQMEAVAMQDVVDLVVAEAEVAPL